MQVLHRDIKILIVDDMPTMRKIVKAVLRQLGYVNFLEAENGEDGFRVLKANSDVALVVSDWNMPKTTGIEFLKMVRADADTRHMPFLLITAEAKKENIMEALKSGVSNYIVKPFTAETLKEKLKAIDQLHAKQKRAG